MAIVGVAQIVLVSASFSADMIVGFFLRGLGRNEK